MDDKENSKANKPKRVQHFHQKQRQPPPPVRVKYVEQHQQQQQQEKKKDLEQRSSSSSSSPSLLQQDLSVLPVRQQGELVNVRQQGEPVNPLQQEEQQLNGQQQEQQEVEEEQHNAQYLPHQQDNHHNSHHHNYNSHHQNSHPNHHHYHKSHPNQHHHHNSHHHHNPQHHNNPHHHNPQHRQSSGAVAVPWTPGKLPVQKEDVDCIICCHRISVHTVHEKCDHDAICWKCTLTSRILNRELFCCVCKVPSEKVIFSAQAHSKKFADFDMSRLLYDHQYSVYTDDPQILDAILELRELRCRVCNEQDATFRSFEKLSSHLSHFHNLVYCPYCLQSRKVFLSEQKMYGKKDGIAVHLAMGEKDAGGIIRGHPLCRFCGTRFYTDDDLFKHMSVHHMECNICKREGVMYNYYSDYAQLETHFRASHFLCENKNCLALKWVVFANELDLKAHEVREHVKKNAKGNAQVQLTMFTMGPSTTTSAPHGGYGGHSGHISHGATGGYSSHGATGGHISHGATGGSSSNTSIQSMHHRMRQPADVDASRITFAGASGDSFDPEMHAKKHAKEDSRRRNNKSGNNRQRAFFKDKHGENRDFEYQGSSPVQQQLENEGGMLASDEQKQRNAELIVKMKGILRPHQFDQFRRTSTDFQKGSLLASEYYKVFVTTFGERADELFDDLISTLPERDKMKRDALQLARSMFHSKEFGEREPPTQSTAAPASETQKPKKKSSKPTVPAENIEWPTLNGAPSNPIWVPQQQTSGGSTVVSTKKKPLLLNEQDFPALPVTAPPAAVKRRATSWQQQSSTAALMTPVVAELEPSWPQNVNLIVKPKKKKK